MNSISKKFYKTPRDSIWWTAWMRAKKVNKKKGKKKEEREKESLSHLLVHIRGWRRRRREENWSDLEREQWSSCSSALVVLASASWSPSQANQRLKNPKRNHPRKTRRKNKRHYFLLQLSISLSRETNSMYFPFSCKLEQFRFAFILCFFSTTHPPTLFMHISLHHMLHLIFLLQQL